MKVIKNQRLKYLDEGAEDSGPEFAIPFPVVAKNRGRAAPRAATAGAAAQTKGSRAMMEQLTEKPVSGKGARLNQAKAQTITSQRSPEELQKESLLIQAAQKGDRAAFEELVVAYEKKVFWIAFNLVNHVEDARDIAQDAFLRVFKALDRFDPKFNFYTWLYRIVVNLAIDRLRKRGKQGVVSIDEFTSDPAIEDQTDRPMMNSELGKKINLILDSMPEKYRTIILLRDVSELSCEEIAKIIKCTNATTRWRLHRAREIFKEKWERLHAELKSEVE